MGLREYLRKWTSRGKHRMKSGPSMLVGVLDGLLNDFFISVRFDVFRRIFIQFHLDKEVLS